VRSVTVREGAVAQWPHSLTHSEAANGKEEREKQRKRKRKQQKRKSQISNLKISKSHNRKFKS